MPQPTEPIHVNRPFWQMPCPRVSIREELVWTRQGRFRAVEAMELICKQMLRAGCSSFKLPGSSAKGTALICLCLRLQPFLYTLQVEGMATYAPNNRAVITCNACTCPTISTAWLLALCNLIESMQCSHSGHEGLLYMARLMTVHLPTNL